jgi:DNA-binding response OmpR family regulator
LLHVLLLDDDPAQLRFRQIALERAGLSVRVAFSAESALALLRDQSAGEEVGAVITDHVLTRTTGAEFVRRLRQLAPRLPVLVVTGLPDAEEQYAGLGVVFRYKPLDPDELVRLVQQALAPAA